MAQLDVLDRINSSGQADTSHFLDILMYASDYLLSSKEIEDKPISEVIMYLNRTIPSDEHDARSAIQIVDTYIKTNPGCELEQLKLSSASASMGGELKGARAATFYKENNSGSKDVYLAFMGTGKGRWFDNGDAFNKKYSPYQQQAAEYFEYSVNKLDIDDSCNVISTGHSKGGNLAQFIALAPAHAGLIDKVIAFDGQGFSPEAVDYFKSIHGEEFIEKQRAKMYSVPGNHDYVNGLGIKMIPEENTVYIESRVNSDFDFFNAHSMWEYLKDEDGSPILSEDGSYIILTNLFSSYGANCHFNEPTLNRGPLSTLSSELSAYIMNKPADERGEVCQTIMTVLEGSIGNSSGLGLYQEKASFVAMLGAVNNLDKIVETVLNSEYVQSFKNRDFVTDYLINNTDLIVNHPVKFAVGLSTSAVLNCGWKVSVKVVEKIVVNLIDTVGENGFKAYLLLNEIKPLLSHVVKLKFSYDYNQYISYISENSHIICDTDQLQEIAGRIERANNQLDELDSNLNALYAKVQLLDLLDLLCSDFKIKRSKKLTKCINYLKNTAMYFNEAEEQIKKFIG